MEYFSSKKFDKQFAKLSQKTQEQFYKRLRLLKIDPFNPVLNNHCVHYPYEGCQSINITGNIRALYEASNSTALFVCIGTHSELYK